MPLLTVEPLPLWWLVRRLDAVFSMVQNLVAGSVPIREAVVQVQLVVRLAVLQAS